MHRQHCRLFRRCSVPRPRPPRRYRKVVPSLKSEIRRQTDISTLVLVGWPPGASVVTAGGGWAQRAGTAWLYCLCMSRRVTHDCEQGLLQGLALLGSGSALSPAQALLQNAPLLPAAAWQLGGASSNAQQGLQNVPLLPAAAWQLGGASSGAQQGLQNVPLVPAQGAQGPQVQMLFLTARACVGFGCGFARRAACACGVPEPGVCRLRCRLCWRWRLSPHSRRQQPVRAKTAVLPSAVAKTIHAMVPRRRRRKTSSSLTIRTLHMQASGCVMV